MRAYRKRAWAPLVVDLTPLIDVIFLIIIFFIILINFSQIHIRNVLLPHADQAYASANSNQKKISLTIKSKDELYLQREQVTLASLSRAIRRKHPNGPEVTALIRANEDVPYELIKLIMIKLATLNINKVEFATWQGTPDPLAPESPLNEEMPDET